jgi:hypothetical protein
VKADANEWRQQFISAIAAWALDHPGQKLQPSLVFPHHLKRMREAIFSDRRPAVAKIARDMVLIARDQGVGVSAERRVLADGVMERLIARFGYCSECGADAASLLMRRRFQDLV